LPIIAAATTANGAVMGVTAAKSASGNAGWLGTVKAFGIFAGVLAVPAAIGGLIGRKLGKDAEGSPSQQAAVGSFWRALGWVVVGLILLPFLLTLFGAGFFPKGPSRLGFLSAMERWMGLAYGGVVVLVAYWVWLRRRATRQVSAVVVSETRSPRPLKTSRIVAWVTVGALGLLIFCLCDTNFRIQNLDVSEMQNIIQKTAPAELRTWVLQVHPHSLFKSDPSWMKFLWVEVRHDGKVTKYSSRFDESTVTTINGKGVDCPTYVQGRDFEILGTPGRMLPFIAAFVVGIGAVYLIRTRRSKTRAV
jgi:uncharacterized membrane protein